MTNRWAKFGLAPLLDRRTDHVERKSSASPKQLLTLMPPG